jgi:hypothetical protein
MLRTLCRLASFCCLQCSVLCDHSLVCVHDFFSPCTCACPQGPRAPAEVHHPSHRAVLRCGGRVRTALSLCARHFALLLCSIVACWVLLPLEGWKLEGKGESSVRACGFCLFVGTFEAPWTCPLPCPSCTACLVYRWTVAWRALALAQGSRTACTVRTPAWCLSAAGPGCVRVLVRSCACDLRAPLPAPQCTPRPMDVVRGCTLVASPDFPRCVVCIRPSAD